METYIPRAGDYLWAFETEEDLWNGLWGLIRAFDEKVPDLIPLPDRPEPLKRSKPLPECTGTKPPPAKDPTLVPIENELVRYFDVVAFQLPIIYNNFGDHDPDGIIFALKEDMDAILKGTKKPEPSNYSGKCWRYRRSDINKLVEIGFISFQRWNLSVSRSERASLLSTFLKNLTASSIDSV